MSELARAVSPWPTTRPSARAAGESVAPWGFLEIFVILQVLAPAILYLPGTQPLRVPIRMLPFALSIAGLIYVFRATRDPRPHPAWFMLLAIVGYLTLMVLHPNTNSFLAGVAQVGLYVSVMAPVFWAPYLVRNTQQVFRVLTIILICNGINAGVGVLQVVNPDRFLPAEYSSIVESIGGPVGYVTDDGKQVVRPPGLSDSPGAVCGPATSAALLGFVALTLRIPWHFKVLAGAFAALGVAAIFLSHVRTNILILGGMAIAYIIVLFVQRETGRALLTAMVGFGLSFGAFVMAVGIGGSAVVDRFVTLVSDDPATVYYASGRGYMLQRDTSRYLEDHPLGAGLGRWGMMRYYFGNQDNPRSPSLWAELQWPAWALDGGWVLLLLYQGVVLRQLWYEWSLITYRRDVVLRRIAGVVFAVNLGTVALIFGYTPFTNQVGLMYWFMAGLLHGMMTQRQETGSR